jgi:HK97 gp10 family phage protein
MSVRVSGIPQLLRNIGRVQKNLADEVQRIVERAGINVQRMAKQNCPVDTGRLRSSIRIYHKDSGAQRQVRVGTDVYYAPYQEFGTSRMRAQPFLFPAWASERPRFLQAVRAVVKNLGAGGGT